MKMFEVRRERLKKLVEKAGSSAALAKQHGLGIYKVPN